MQPVTDVKCAVVYAGPSYPQFHGTRCELTHPHEGQKHQAWVQGIPLTWWTADEKLRRKEAK